MNEHYIITEYQRNFEAALSILADLGARMESKAKLHNFAPTVLIDLDGVVVEHCGPTEWYEPLRLLPGVLDRFTEWWNAGVRIIIITGRPNSNKLRLEFELSRLKIFYHQLLMDAGSGPRYIINDAKPYDPERKTAVAINLPRNEGLANLIDIK